MTKHVLWEVLFAILIINISCNKRNGCSMYDSELLNKRINGNTLIIAKFDKPVFFNKDYSFESIPKNSVPVSNFLKINLELPYYFNTRTPSENISYIPLPTDRNEFSLVVNYKDSIRDTIDFKYEVRLVFIEDDICVGSYYYLDADLKSYKATSNFVKVSLNEYF